MPFDGFKPTPARRPRYDDNPQWSRIDVGGAGEWAGDPSLPSSHSFSAEVITLATWGKDDSIETAAGKIRGGWARRNVYEDDGNQYPGDTWDDYSSGDDGSLGGTSHPDDPNGRGYSQSGVVSRRVEAAEAQRPFLGVAGEPQHTVQRRQRQQQRVSTAEGVPRMGVGAGVGAGGGGGGGDGSQMDDLELMEAAVEELAKQKQANGALKRQVKELGDNLARANASATDLRKSFERQEATIRALKDTLAATASNGNGSGNGNVDGNGDGSIRVIRRRGLSNSSSGAEAAANLAVAVTGGGGAQVMSESEIQAADEASALFSEILAAASSASASNCHTVSVLSTLGGSGSGLNPTQVGVLLEQLSERAGQAKPNESRIVRAFQEMDVDSDGVVTLNEFEEWWQDNHTGAFPYNP